MTMCQCESTFAGQQKRVHRMQGNFPKFSKNTTQWHVAAMEYLVILYTVLNVDETDNIELLGKLGSPVPNHFQALCWNGLWGHAAC